jgi:UDP-N-acetylglucosamine 4-epimerase
LFNAIKNALNENEITYTKKPIYRDFRKGDVRHSQASVKKIANLLGYEAKYNIDEGIDLAMNWYSSKV